MAYFWAGSSDVYEVTLTVRSTNIYGSINGNGKKFVIESRSNQRINRLFEVNPEGVRPAGEGDYRGGKFNVENTNENKFDESNITIGDIIKHETKEQRELDSNRSQFDNILDTLIVFTDEARINQGGDPLDVMDDIDIQLLIENSVDNTNLAFSNSEVDGYIPGYYTTRLDGFTFTGTSNGYTFDLKNFRELSAINTARTQVNADIVSGVIYADVATFPVCGVSHVQTQTSCGLSNAPTCGVGTLMYDFAYNLVINECAVLDNSFPHEYGHLLGANHSRATAAFDGYLSDIVNNGFPEAFAYITPVGQHKTLMDITGITSTRKLYFSNPNVVYSSESFGVTGTEFNVNEINQLIPVMVDFETRPDLIFEDDFE